MIKYKLLKDLPTFKAGSLFYISEYGALVYDNNNGGVMAYTRQTLEKFPDILTEWFEEIKEPIDNIYWKPAVGDKYWILGMFNHIEYVIWRNDKYDENAYYAGNIYRTKEECGKARERKLAEVRLRRTSMFKPDWSNDNQDKWTVYYDHSSEELLIEATAFLQYSSAIYFDTYDSIKNPSKKTEKTG